MSSRTGILRSNWRMNDDSELGFALLGSNIIAGSFLPAVASGLGGASVLGGGFIMGSFASQLSGVGFLQISALGALSAFFGTGNLGVNTSGYRFIPFNFVDLSGDGVSSPIFIAMSATMALADSTSVAVIGVRKASQTVGSGIMMTSASNISVHFVWAGWIISAPG